MFPRLRIVALEPDALAHRLARRNVEAARLERRIELRRQRVEQWAADETVDTAHIAQAFLSQDALCRGVPRVYRAVRPGGWIITSAVSRTGDDLAAAVSRLQNVVLSGRARVADEIVALLDAAGFVDIAVLESLGAVSPIVARRPPRARRGRTSRRVA